MYNVPEVMIPAKVSISHGFIYLVDLTNLDSLQSATDMHMSLSSSFPANAFSCIIGTKADNINTVVSCDDLDNLSKLIGGNNEVL